MMYRQSVRNTANLSEGLQCKNYIQVVQQRYLQYLDVVTDDYEGTTHSDQWFNFVI